MSRTLGYAIIIIFKENDITINGFDFSKCFTMEEKFNISKFMTISNTSVILLEAVRLELG